MTATRSTRLATLAGAMVGAAIVAVVLAATGGSGGGTPTPAVASGPVAQPGALHPASLYIGASPGVVDITARSTTTVRSPFGARKEQSTALGAGIVLDGRGHLLTADHVVRGSSSVTVEFANGTSRSARVLGQDATTDLAVLGVAPSGLTLHPLRLGDSAALRIGDPVAAIGSPFGYTRSLSTGVVSGLDRTISGLNGFSIAHAVQTDAAIDPGNSGGPLLDRAGDVIGVVDQIATGSSGADSSTGVGFAVSSNVAEAEISGLERGATPPHAFLGTASAPTPGGGSGVVVESVQPGGPAARAGVHPGDVIRTIDGRQLRGVDDLIAIVSGHRPGQTVTLGIVRGARRATVRVVLGTQPRGASAR